MDCGIGLLENGLRSDPKASDIVTAEKYVDVMIHPELHISRGTADRNQLPVLSCTAHAEPNCVNDLGMSRLARDTETRREVGRPNEDIDSRNGAKLFHALHCLLCFDLDHQTQVRVYLLLCFRKTVCDAVIERARNAEVTPRAVRTKASMLDKFMDHLGRVCHREIDNVRPALGRLQNVLPAIVRDTNHRQHARTRSNATKIGCPFKGDESMLHLDP